MIGSHCRRICLMTISFSLLQNIVNCQVLDRRWTRSQGWGPWTSWSACSTSCDHELSKRSRTCLEKPKSAYSESQGTQLSCNGTQKQYKICDKQDCIGKRTDYRKQECKKQNKKPFRGRFYIWDPFINPHNKCEVACQAQVYRFVTGFGRPVRDGIPCDDDRTDTVCLHGKCQETGFDISCKLSPIETTSMKYLILFSWNNKKSFKTLYAEFAQREQVGCDGIIGSKQQKDHCGVCGGDNDSCRIIAGIYTRTHHRYGYQQITQIPKGACHINVTELSRSRNYLALQYTNGTSILNGKRSLSHTGNYPAAGTVFHYNRFSGTTCPGECLFADGPLRVPLDLKLLTYRRNPGIKYMFTVPKDMLETVMQGFNSPDHKDSSVSGQDKSHDQALNERIGFKERPQYVAPYSAHSNYQSLQGTDRRHGTQEAINRYHAGYSVDSSTNRIDTSSNRRRNSHSSNYGLSGSLYSPVSGQTGYQTYNREYRQSGQTGSFVGRTEYQPSNSVPVPAADAQPKLQISNTIDSVNFHWSISGFTECSETCGGGRQDTEIVCMKRKTNIVVTDENCDPREKPRVQTVTCNTKPCPPVWEKSDWSACSETCGPGTQTRKVECKQRISSDLTVVVNERSCDTSSRPSASQTCQDQPCAEWLLGNWTACSVNCGVGQRTRTVECVNVAGEVVPNRECDGVKPETSQSCDMGVCAKGWYHTAWSEECSSECGSGYHTRTVYCAAPDGSKLEEVKCGEKPRTRKPCKKTRPCGGHWFEGPWSQCSATCGLSMRSRDVVCMKKLGEELFAVVEEENCQGKPKPVTEEPCPKLGPCPPEWFNTKWSECSKSCGTGVKSRDILCLDTRLTPSSSCLETDKPAVRRTCNTQSCDLPQLDEDPGCKDEWTRCKLVVQARMCRYQYYEAKCCHSCTIHKLKHKHH